MKVYASPVPFAEPDYRNYNREVEIKREKDHQDAIRAWLKTNGFTGKHSGEVYRTPIADGYAEYILADGPKSFLIHLPYGDAYNDPNIRFIPKKEIIRRIEADKAWRANFKRV